MLYAIMPNFTPTITNVCEKLLLVVKQMKQKYNYFFINKMKVIIYGNIFFKSIVIVGFI